MPRKLKTYQTSLGFYDLAIAAPSMKAALEAWGADSNLFHQGAARESDDPDVIATTMAAPGVVLKRPVGSNTSFKEHSELPKSLPGAGPRERRGKASPKYKKKPRSEISEKAKLKAATDYEREQAKREAARQREQAALARTEKAIAKAKLALDQASEAHEATADAIQAERALLDQKAQEEQARWEKQKEKLEAALHRARG